MLHLAATNGTLMAPPRVYSYTRFSTPEQAQGDSFRRQTAAARVFADKHGLELDSALSAHDGGVSAFRGAHLTPEAGLGRFITAVDAGLVAEGSILLIESLDRFSRMEPIFMQHQLTGLMIKGVQIATLTDNRIYSRDSLRQDNGLGLMVALMVGIRAHEESATKGRRVAAAWEEKRRQVATGRAEHYTRRAPAWLLWTSDGWQLHPERAEIVRRIFRDTINGAGENIIAQTLNAEGVPVMGRGIMWHRTSVAKILRNVAAIGTLVTGRMDFATGKKRRVENEPVAGFYPAVVTLAEWTAVRAIKDGSISRARGKSAALPIQNMLAGMARCPECGATMTRVYKGERAKAGAPKLVCTKAKLGAAAHSYVSVSLEAVHGALVNGWQHLIHGFPAGDRAPALDREAASLASEIAGTEDHLAELLELLDRAPSLALSARIQAAEASLSALQTSLTAIEQSRAVADGGLVHARLGGLAAAFEPEEDEPLDCGKINAALRLLFSGVTVDYRTGWLRFEWRQGGVTELIYAMAPVSD